MLEVADETADVVLGAVGGTAEILGDAIEGADELIEGVRRAGLKRLISLLIVIVAIAAIVSWLRSRNTEPEPTTV